MNRLLVALLAAFDAVLVVAVGVAAALAPLTALWVTGLGGSADWAALWPAAGRLWQLGNLVPLEITLPDSYLVAAGIPVEAASFSLSLAPLAFGVFTAVFAARSGARAARAGAWLTGVGSGTLVVGALAAGITATTANSVASVEPWQAILAPVALFALPALAAALVGAWRAGDDGLVDRARGSLPPLWEAVPAAAARGAGVVLAGVLGAGAAVLALALLLRGGEVIALFESAHVDLAGVISLALAQAAYLPTLVFWAAAYVAGPGFAVGTGTAVSPAGTSLGVIPGIPVLGLVPESPSPWTLVLLLLVVGAGALGGWAARIRLSAGPAGDEPVLPRVVTALAIAAASAGVAALGALGASGAFGPGRLAELGPSAGAVALAVGLEAGVGAAILLLSPRRAASEGAGVDAGHGWREATHPRWEGRHRRRGERAPVGFVPFDADATGPVEPLNLDATAPVEPIDPDAAPPVDPDATAPIEPVDPIGTEPVEPVDPDGTGPAEPVDPDATAPIEPLQPGRGEAERGRSLD
jgi:hypothetical protein